MQLGLAAAAIIVVISLLFYGLNDQRGEEQEISTRAPAAPTTNGAGPATQPAQSQQNPGHPPQPGQQQDAQQGRPPATSGQGEQKP